MTQSERNEDRHPTSTWKYVTIERYNMVMKASGPCSDRFSDELLPDRSTLRKKVDRLDPILGMDLKPEADAVDPIDVP